MGKFHDSIKAAYKEFIGVPMYDITGDRDIHFDWAEKKGADGLYEYVQQNNLKSLDGLPTDIALKTAAN